MKPVLLEWGPFHLYSYGLLIALGGLATARFWRSRREAMGLRGEDDFWLLLNAVIAGGFIGGRLLFVFEYTSLFSADFWSSLISVSRGFSVMGAFFGVLAAVWWVARRAGTPFSRLLDYVCVAAPLWHAFGRAGCFLAGCCYGRPSDVPWAVTFTDARALVEPPFRGVPLHPAQLYEAFGDLLIFTALYLSVLPSVEAGLKPRGSAALAYLLSYSALRFVTEYFRGDAIVLPFGLTAAQGLCLALAATAVALYKRNSLCIQS